MTKTVAIVGAGIVGVSTAIWALRDGHKVILIDREGPAAGTSFGNGGVLASAAVIPVSTPGLLRKAPAMLLDPNEPLFLKWRYTPKLIPYLMKFLRYTSEEAVRVRAKAMKEIIGEIWAFLAVLLGALLLMILVPDIVLWLPRLFGYQG